MVTFSDTVSNQITFNSFEVPLDVGVFSMTYEAVLGGLTRTMSLSFELIYCEYEKIYTQEEFVAEPGSIMLSPDIGTEIVLFPHF